MDGKEWKAKTETLSTDEKAEVWPDITAKYKNYGGDQEKTDRRSWSCAARPSEVDGQVRPAMAATATTRLRLNPIMARSYVRSPR